MFPGIDGFHWTVGHILFLCLFFAVVVTLLMTIGAALWRTARDFRTHRAGEMCWNADFADLPERERRCRHELAGRVISRTCENAFDCRSCEKYAEFAVLPPRGIAHDMGLHYPADRFYHRGHTWVKPEQDGTFSIGLDELAERLVGKPDSIRMPEVGQELDLNQIAWRMKKNGREIHVRAPIEGTVVAVGTPNDAPNDASNGSPNQAWYLKVRPRLDPHDRVTLRHLLRGPEVDGWLARELERLQLQLRAPNTAPSLADGGVLLPNLMDSMREADWDTVLADTFLEP